VFLVDLCDRYPRDSFGVCLDFGNLPGDVRRFAIRRLARITNHAHVKSYDFDARGVETTIPLTWAVAELDRAGFAGQWVIEYEGPPPYKLGIAQTVAALRSTLRRPTVGGPQPW
jgi:hypothetical protein